MEDLTNQCTHYWKIDDYNVGHCIKPGCGAVKDFGALLKKLQREFNEPSGPGESLPKLVFGRGHYNGFLPSRAVNGDGY